MHVPLCPVPKRPSDSVATRLDYPQTIEAPFDKTWSKEYLGHEVRRDLCTRLLPLPPPVHRSGQKHDRYSWY